MDKDGDRGAQVSLNSLVAAQTEVKQLTFIRMALQSFDRIKREAILCIIFHGTFCVVL